MSWRKAGTTSLVAMAASLTLGGCLQPMYGQFAAGGPGLETELRAIAIEPIPDQFGHYLGDDLIFALNGTGSHPIPKYKLFVAYDEGVQSPLLDTVTGRPSAATIVINGNYRLERISPRVIVAKGRVFVFKSYDRTSYRYSNIRAARDAEIRDAKVLADEIATRLGAALADPAARTRALPAATPVPTPVRVPAPVPVPTAAAPTAVAAPHS